MTGWRRADFMADQRQSISASGADKLRDLLMDSKQAEYAKALDSLADAQDKLARRRDAHQRAASRATVCAFSHYGDMPGGRAARHGAVAGAIVGVIPAAVALLTTTPPQSDDYPALGFLSQTAWTLFTWPAVGWFIGYYLPLIRGRNGTEKALWLSLLVIGANVPFYILWDTPQQLILDLTGTVATLVFLVLVAVYVSDLLPINAAGYRLRHWTQVHNWRFVATWSTALIAAIGTVAVTFMTVATTDLANYTLKTPTSQSAGSTSGGSGSTP